MNQKDNLDRNNRNENDGSRNNKNRKDRNKNGENRNRSEKKYKTPEEGGSAYLLARDESQTRERQKELLYRVLGPVFFGEKKAESRQELVAFFRTVYGIDVEHDFYEGDEHYEEYLEAGEAIAEGMQIYGGRISFADDGLAELAEEIWKRMEEEGKGFRRINTMLEE